MAITLVVGQIIVCGMSIHRPTILVANSGIQTSTCPVDLEGGTSQGEDMRR
jgi:hypothetical protein